MIEFAWAVLKTLWSWEGFAVLLIGGFGGPTLWKGVKWGWRRLVDKIGD